MANSPMLASFPGSILFFFLFFCFNFPQPLKRSIVCWCCCTLGSVVYSSCRAVLCPGLTRWRERERKMEDSRTAGNCVWRRSRGRKLITADARCAVLERTLLALSHLRKGRIELVRVSISNFRVFLRGFLFSFLFQFFCSP